MLLPDSRVLIVERGNKRVFDLGDRVVKVFNEEKPVSDVFNEALNLARINECGIPSPRIAGVEPLDGEGWGLFTRKVPGCSLASLMARDPSRFYEYLELFVDLQVSIHQHRCPLLPRQRDKYGRMIEGLTELSATQRYDLMGRVNGLSRQDAVCHGDFNPTNVIVGEDGALTVCDWAHATQGSPTADAAMTYLLFALDDRNQADAYLELFCDRADEPMQVVRQWMSVVAAGELARRRLDRDPDLLMHWIDVFDYQ